MKSRLLCGIVVTILTAFVSRAKGDEKFHQQMGLWESWVKADAKLSVLIDTLGKPDEIHGQFYTWYGALDRGTALPKSLYAYVMDYNGTMLVLALSDGTQEGLIIFPWANDVMRAQKISP